MIYVFQNPIVKSVLEEIYRGRKTAIRLISISNMQRRGYSGKEWTTIYNAIDIERYSLSEHPKQPEYLAFLGRITENKGADLAVMVAKKTGLPLRLAGNVSDESGGKEFFESRVRPYLDETIEWVGEITDDQKSEFLGNACALLAPLRWDEPFGIVMIEALACGTPVVAMSRGAMPEIIQDGINGYLVSSEAEMAQAVARINGISRQACRADCEARFGVDRMVSRYLDVMQSLIGKKPDTQSVDGRTFRATA